MIKIVSFVEKMLFDSEKIAIFGENDELLFKGYKKDFLQKNILHDYSVSTFWISYDKLIISVKQ